jgi:hypothetical protein
MSFIWFIIKIYAFGILYSIAMGFALLPLLTLAASARPGMAPDALTVKRPGLEVLIVGAMFVLCVVQAFIIAAAVRVSLETRPEAWWPLWYVLGLGAAFQSQLAGRGQGKTRRAKTSQVICGIGAAVGYAVASLWPTIVPSLLLRVAEFLAV